MTKKTRRVAKARRALLTLSLVLVVAFAAVGGTIAWLTDMSDTVTNTFNPTKIDVSLTETTGPEYDIIPGGTITKDPKVTLSTDSEASYVFVLIEEKNSYANYFDTTSYEIADGWTVVPNATEKVYYREVAADTGLEAVAVLKNNTVTVPNTLTQDNMLTIANATEKPQLVFTAYAIQQVGFEGKPLDAWNAVKGTSGKYYTQPATIPDP